MKKTFLFRLLAITFFCLASLAIKSEISFCKSTCHRNHENGASVHLSVLNEDVQKSPHKYDAFFIKI